MPSVELDPTAFTISVLNVPIPIRLSKNLSSECGRVSYNVKLIASISKEFFEMPISISSFPNLKATPNILLSSVLLSTPIVTAVVSIYFAEEAFESPIFPMLTAPSLQYDQLPDWGSADEELLLLEEAGIIKFDKEAKFWSEKWNLIFWLVKLPLLLFLLNPVSYTHLRAHET